MRRVQPEPDDQERLAAFVGASRSGLCRRLLGDFRGESQSDIDRRYADCAMPQILAVEFARIPLGGLAALRARRRLSVRWPLFVRSELGVAAAAELEHAVDATCATVDGGRLSLADIRAKQRIARSEALRQELSAAERDIYKRLSDLRLQYWVAAQRSARLLGFPNVAAVLQATKELDLATLCRDAKSFLAESEALYRFAFSKYWSSCIKGKPEAGDVPFLFNHWPRIDLPARDMVERVMDYAFNRTRSSGVPECGMYIEDIDRPGKTSRPFAIAIDPPFDIVISIRGSASYYAVEEMLHEIGHAVAFAGIDPKLDWVERTLWDDVVQETFAFISGGLVRNRAFLSDVTGLSSQNAEAYAAYSSFLELYLARRHAAKVLLEVQVHTQEIYSEASDLYTKTLASELGIDPMPQRALEDLDEDFISADYLRAWFTAAAVEEHLEIEFGLNWFSASEALRIVTGLSRAGGGLTRRKFAAAFHCSSGSPCLLVRRLRLGLS
jgi:hypothetical protein